MKHPSHALRAAAAAVALAAVLSPARASLSGVPDAEGFLDRVHATGRTDLCAGSATGRVVASRDVRVGTEESGALTVFTDRARGPSAWTLSHAEDALGDLTIAFNLTAPAGVTSFEDEVGTVTAGVLFGTQTAEPDGLVATARLLGPDGETAEISVAYAGGALVTPPARVPVAMRSGVPSIDLRIRLDGDDVHLESADPNETVKTWSPVTAAADALPGTDSLTRRASLRVNLPGAGASLRMTGAEIGGFLFPGTGKQIAVSGSAIREGVAALESADAAGAQMSAERAADDAADVIGFLDNIPPESLAALRTTEKKLRKPLEKAVKAFTAAGALYGKGKDAPADGKVRGGMKQTIRALALFRGMTTTQTKAFTALLAEFTPE